MKIKITYEFLKKNDLILFEAIVGSHAYNTNTESSDIDKKFIYILPEENIFGFNYQDSLEINKDYFGWEIKRFLELIKVNNPTAMEFLNSPDDCILHKSPFFDDILKNKDKFISKLALKSFTGYAVQQIKNFYYKYINNYKKMDILENFVPICPKQTCKSWYSKHNFSIY